MHAGAEPLYFTNIFPQWTDWDEKDVSKNEVRILHHIVIIPKDKII